MYKFFEHKGTIYVSKSFRYASLATFLFFLILTILTLLLGFLNNESDCLYILPALIPTFIYGKKWGTKVEINHSEKTITCSHFGLGKKVLSLNSFVNFELLNYKAFGKFDNGTDINMIYTENGKKLRFTLFSRLSDKKNIETIVSEMRSIMNLK